MFTTLFRPRPNYPPFGKQRLTLCIVRHDSLVLFFKNYPLYNIQNVNLLRSHFTHVIFGGGGHVLNKHVDFFVFS